MQPKFIVVRVKEHVQSEDVEPGYLVMGSCFGGGTHDRWLGFCSTNGRTQSESYFMSPSALRLRTPLRA